MTKRLAFLIAGILAGSYACRNDGPRDIRDYYFPLRALTEGMVYEYRANDTLTPVYWYYRSFLGRDGRSLTSTYYEQELAPLQLAREEMTSDGMALRDLYLYNPGPEGASRRTEVQVEAAKTFPFRVKDRIEVSQLQVSWTDEAGQRITVTRDRRYAGDTTFVFQGKSYPCVVFSISESVVLAHPEYGTTNPMLQGREAYAKGLGLVFYEKAPVGTTPVTYRLHDRYPMAKLEAQARRNLPVE